MRAHIEKTRFELERYVYCLEREVNKRTLNRKVMFISLGVNFVLIGFITGGLLP
ncbi:hypothetical protein [Brucella pituitosa]|uniref:hypothetical protein n=1 Tax=Brucella pituitosa TaxID=571256 RepID=UPI003F4AD131